VVRFPALYRRGRFRARHGHPPRHRFGRVKIGASRPRAAPTGKMVGPSDVITHHCVATGNACACGKNASERRWTMAVADESDDFGGNAQPTAFQVDEELAPHVAEAIAKAIAER
jgi:hypothetical protein